MVATLPMEVDEKAVEGGGQSIELLLRPDVLVEGHEPEARVSYHGLSWQRYLEVDKAFGDDRPGPRFYYLDEELEIMSTSEEHERIKKRIADLLVLYFFERGVEAIARGQATMRLPHRQAGIEPDESWCIGEEKPFPDLALEIALTSGGVDKLAAYARFAVAEVWIWRLQQLEAYALRQDGEGYDKLEAGSRLFPDLDLTLLERCVKIPGLLEAGQAFRAGLAAER